MNILDLVENATTPSMDIKEYLAYLGDRINSEILTMLLSSSSALNFANTVNRHAEPVPDIRFDISSNPDASAIPGLIMITDGMVTHCSRLSIPHAARAIIGIPKEVNIEAPSAAFSFVLLHEYFHIQRKHNDSQAAIVNDYGDAQRSREPLTTQQIGRALEYDADLCAAGVIYRLTQVRHSEELDDM